MYIEANGNKYSCGGIHASGGDIMLTLPDKPTLSGTVQLISEDNDFVLREISCGDYARQVWNGDVLTLTNAPAPAEPTDEELLATARAAAMERIDGKCSAAIYSGVTVGDKHFSLTPIAQSNLQNAVARVNAGATTVPFAADGEAMSLYTAEAITALSTAANNWGTVNICYYEQLKAWIAEETDTAVLNAIDYGSMLPEARMTALGTQLAGFGINIIDYAAALGG